MREISVNVKILLIVTQKYSPENECFLDSGRFSPLYIEQQLKEYNIFYFFVNQSELLTGFCTDMEFFGPTENQSSLKWLT